MMENQSLNYLQSSQIRNTERIRDLAEVFTAEKEVKSMLDLLEPLPGKIDSRFLEPSCGNGNFLVEILKRKLKIIGSQFRGQVNYEFLNIIALSNIYAVDIDKHNIKEAHFRLKETIIDNYSKILNTISRSPSFDNVIESILRTNIIKGDMINGINKIKFTEYSSPRPNKILRRTYRLVDLLSGNQSSLWSDSPTPVAEYPIVNFWELCNDIE